MCLQKALETGTSAKCRFGLRGAGVGPPGGRVGVGERHRVAAARCHDRLGDEGGHRVAGDRLAGAVLRGDAAESHVLRREVVDVPAEDVGRETSEKRETPPAEQL